MDLATLTIAQARKDLDARTYTAVDLAQAYLDAIKQKDSEIRAYLEVFADVIDQAKAADAMIAADKSMPMTGIPMAIKDNILIKGRIASASSKILANYVASYDATVIQKLKDHGAVFLGRTNMDEFAMGSSTENSSNGPTKNPHDTRRVPGGSSGGSAAAVAANMALAALGTDTGGSVRQPAALCGVVGLKTTYGMVSRYGAIAMGSSLDQICPLAKTVEDAQIVYEAIKGHDDMDGTSLPNDFYQDRSVNRKKKIGVPRAFLKEGIDPDVLARFDASLENLKKNGYEIVDVELPSFAYGLPVYYIIMPAEVSTNLSRFDGIRYGLSVAGETVKEVNERSRGEGFGKEARRRILLGTFVLSSGYYDAYYRKASAVRDVMRTELAEVFETVDAIATPTSPTPAFVIGEKADPLAMYAADIFTVPVNLVGVPAISVPGGTVQRDGIDLPVGFQLIGRHGGEEALFELGRLAA